MLIVTHRIILEFRQQRATGKISQKLTLAGDKSPFYGISIVVDQNIVYLRTQDMDVHADDHEVRVSIMHTPSTNTQWILEEAGVLLKHISASENGK